VSDTVSSSTQDYSYGTYQYTGTITAGTPVTAGSTDADTGGAAILEIQPVGTLAIDASSPASISSESLGQALSAVTTAAFTPPAGSILVALISAAGTPYGQVSMMVSDSYGLTWTEAVKSNATGNGYAGIWIATAPDSLTAPATATLPGGSVGVVYSGSVTASSGYAPYTYALASGSLPAGLALNPDGTIIGTPTAAATSTFTVKVTDAAKNTATSGTQTLTIVAASTSATPYLSGQWQKTGLAYSYGTTTVKVATTEHDWIFAVVSWTSTNDSSTATAYLTDDAHNIYRPILLAPGSPCRIQIFAVPNARAATKVYAATNAFVRNIQVTVLTVRNLEPGYVVDVTSPLTGSALSGWTHNITTTQPDFVLAAGETNGKGSQPNLPTAWSPLQNSGASSGSVVGWQVAPAPGAVSVPFTISGAPFAIGYTGAVVAVYSQAAGIMSSPDNPAWPDIKVMAAFGFTPGTASGPPNWTDISSRFLALNGPRGRTFELDELSAADMELELDNFDGALTPGNFNSPYGAVTLITPIQVLADWQGRRYALFTGVLNAVPETYDFERSIVKLAVTDDYSKLPQVLLPSCQTSEILYDNPLHVWPLNEPQGSGQASNWSGRSTSILVPVNCKYGGGASGNTPTTGFGNQANQSYPLGLEGSSDTVWGNYGATVGSVYLKGTALSCRGHTPLPLNTGSGSTYEVWANIQNNAASLSSRAVMTLTDDKGTGASGRFFSISAWNQGSVASPRTAFWVSQQGLSWGSTQSFKTKNLFDNGWHHYAVTIDAGNNMTVYIDGVSVGSFTATFPENASPTRLQFGGDITINPAWSQNSGGGFFTGYLAGAAVYDKVLDPERISSHYYSGADGFVTDTSGVRIQRVLTYGHWSAPQAIEPGVAHMQIFNYLGNGYGTSGISGAIGAYGAIGYTGGGGYVDNGAQADVTISDIVASECGFLSVGADGTLAFRGRDTTLDITSRGALGDQDNALNSPTTFAGGLGWSGSGQNCTATTSSAWSYAGGKSALITVNAAGSNAYPYVNNTPVPAGQEIGSSAWLMSPQGCWVQLVYDYYNSANSYLGGFYPTPTWCPPNTPVQLKYAPVTPDAGTAYVLFHPTITNSPAIGTQLYVDRIRLSLGGFEVPYNGDVQTITDIQYLFNDVMVTRNIDQSFYRAKSDTSRDKYYPRVYTRTIYSNEEDPQAVVDCANWLLGSYAEPEVRVSRVVVDAAANPEAWPFVLGTDIGDLVDFERNPVQGAPISGAFMVLSVEPDIAKDKAEFTYVLAPSVGLTVLTLDDPVYGLLGNYQLVW
jgi:hypothetical protein